MGLATAQATRAATINWKFREEIEIEKLRNFE